MLEVRGLSRGRAVRDVSFQLRRGEILGVAGLVGAGRTELGRLIFGADPKDSGEILVDGQVVDIGSPADAVSHGISYLSEDRKRYGLALGLDVETNVAMASYRRFLRALGQVNTGLTRRVAEQRVEELAIKTPSVAAEGTQPVGWHAAEGRGGEVAHGGDGESSSSTSPPAASTSAPSRRSTTCSTSSRRKASRSS